MSLPISFPADVSYQASDCAVKVRVTDLHQAQAIQAFAAAKGFAFPAPPNARPVYFCSAKTHTNGEVLWA